MVIYNTPPHHHHSKDNDHLYSSNPFLPYDPNKLLDNGCVNMTIPYSCVLPTELSLCRPTLKLGISRSRFTSHIHVWMNLCALVSMIKYAIKAKQSTSQQIVGHALDLYVEERMRTNSTVFVLLLLQEVQIAMKCTY